jgi:hypothetical protein
MAGCCEHGNERSGFTEDEEFLDQFLKKKYFVP